MTLTIVLGFKILLARCQRAGRTVALVALLTLAGALAADDTAPSDLPNTISRESDQDRQALIALYHATDGPTWARQEGWLTAPLIEDWKGVTVNNGRVVALSLKSNRLSGHLPNELSNLTQLRRLELPGNNLVGRIPTSLGNLSLISHLDLRWNFLEGEIPTEIVELPSVLTLLLAANRLSGPIPNTFTEMSLLHRLDLSHNNLTGEIPDNIVTLQQLRALGLQHNRLRGSIPIDLGNLTQLERLYLHDNELDGEVPETLAELVKLTYVDLSNNQLSGGIPASIGRLTRLKWISLGGNRLSGKVPSTFADLPRLEFLNISRNPDISRLPTGTYVRNVPNATQCDLAHSTYECIDDRIPRALNGGDYLSATTSEVADDKLRRMGIEALRAVRIVSGFAVVDYDMIPDWLSQGDAEILVDIINIHLREYGYTIQSKHDIVRLIEAYEGPQLELKDREHESPTVSPKSILIGPPTDVSTHLQTPKEVRSTQFQSGDVDSLKATSEVGLQKVVIGHVYCRGTVHGASIDMFESVTSSADADCHLEKLVPHCPPIDWQLRVTMTRKETWGLFWFPLVAWYMLRDEPFSQKMQYRVSWTGATAVTEYCPNGEIRTKGRVYFQAPPPIDTDGSPAPIGTTYSQISSCTKPPADCRFADYFKYNAAVERHCKIAPPKACKGNDACSVLKSKRTHFNRCLSARKKREDTCFAGGDAGHRTQIQNVETSIIRCNKFIQSNCPWWIP